MKTSLSVTSKALLLLLLFVLPAALQAQDFTYTTNNNTITIRRYTGPAEDVTIPSTITGLPVTRIRESAFEGCSNVTSVTIPDSVTTIGVDAFLYCSSLTSVTIPDSTTNIGVDAFRGCSSLTAITVDSLNSVYSSADGVLFNKTQTTLIQCPGGKAGSYTIPESVSTIGQNAFRDCDSLTKVTIPDSVTTIGEDGFRDCSSLTNITIPATITNIVHDAFHGCSSLRGVYFEGNALEIDEDVFEDADNVTVYYLPGTIGWGPTFGFRPTVLWNPQVRTSDSSFGIGPDGFGFNVTGTANIPIVVETSTDLLSDTWVILQSCNLTNSLLYFSDPDWTNHHTRYYRLRSP